MPWKKKKVLICTNCVRMLHEEKVLEKKRKQLKKNKKYKNLFAAGEIFCLAEKIKFQI